MKTLITLCAAVTPTGCSTIMNDRMQDVSIVDPLTGDMFELPDEVVLK